MAEWTTLETALTCEGKTITLQRCRGSYMIRLDGAELMSTRSHTSEERLGTAACAHLKDVRRARVLIGGLGLGYTLRAVLKALRSDATVVVAEMMPCVIAWNRNPDYRLAAEALADPRVILRQQDVAEAIGSTRGLYDAIALDVDNGPNALCLDGNYRLYNDSGLRLARAALRPGGCLALWCASPDPGFEGFLAEAGFIVMIERLRSRGRAGRLHGILLARVK